MAQGSFKSGKGGTKIKGKVGGKKSILKGNAKPGSQKPTQKRCTAQGPRKGSSIALPKNTEKRVQAKKDLEITRAINANTLQTVASMAHRNQEKLFLNDVKTVAKERVKMENKLAKTRKKTRIEEKLRDAKAKLAKKEAKEWKKA